MSVSSADTLAAPNVVILDETLDLNATTELARTFAGLRGAPVTVDPSHVSRMGAQCAQVLIAAAKTWRADGIYFAITPGSEPFNEGMDLLGLKSFFSSERA